MNVKKRLGSGDLLRNATSIIRGMLVIEVTTKREKVACGERNLATILLK